METALPQTIISCTQCGGELHPDEGQMFLTCPYCSSTVYLDKSRVVFHWFVAPTLNEAQARGALARWMASNETVKDLDEKSQVTGVAFEYFPLWYFKRRQPNGQEQVLLTPAAATAVTELSHLNLPAGDLRRYNNDLDSQSHAPSVPLTAAMDWLGQQGVAKGQVTEQSLVHVPLYTFKYNYRNAAYTAVVEGATGSVLANIYPAKAEAPYLLIGWITALVCLCLATFPVIGALDSAEGFGIGLALCTGAALVVGPVLFAIAAWIAAKV